ncbi:MAG TPA: hypothetical protein VIV40_21250 [Kofleriaceae bacterium]
MPRIWLRVILAGAASLTLGCKDDAGTDRAPPASAAPCHRAFGEKLGVPFVRVCPDDLPGVIQAPFWIAAAPIGCTSGEHAAIACPPVVALAPPRGGDPTIQARNVQVIDAASAHRTCMLRFGGRLPTSIERAQAHDALGLDTVVVTERSDHLDFQLLAEWTTEKPCMDPSTLGACTPAAFPAAAVAEVDWVRLRSCTARPASAADALVVEPGESCPLAGAVTAPRCLLASISPGAAPRPAFELACRALTAAEAVRPASQHPERAAFRCVVPDGALVGTVTP